MNDYTIASPEGVVIAQVSHSDITEHTGTPYDTGARLEPHPWVRDGITGHEYQRPAEADDYGRVDFDDDEAATVLSVRVGKLASGAYSLSVTRVRDVCLVVDVDGEQTLIVRPAAADQEEN